MNERFSAPWHALSYERFLANRLPELLAERLPLAGYAVQPENEYHCRVTVEISTNQHTLRVDYPNLPRPDAQGLFRINDEPYIVVPIASREELDQAVVQCVGEQLLAYLSVRLGQAGPEMTGPGMAWDEAVARAFLPLDAWFSDFLASTAQRLDTTNWHSRNTHLRRVLIPSRQKVIAPGQQGRVDPFETPEGPYIGRVFTIALGAEIRDERIVIIDASPEAGLGHNSAQIPFLEHNDPNRLLMGVNMMRQALVPPDPEPALVQTGNAPDGAGADLWCGRNLLTAFIAWGEGTVEDGLIISESCAQRLNYPYPAEPGDKLSNRHGTKGVVSQVLPDAQMPHLTDGTPVEIIFSFAGLHTRMNFGQVREAVMSRIARVEGKPAIVPPFHAPSAEEIRARLSAAGLPESGQETLRLGKDGPQLSQPSTVGWVYWYRLAQLAREKVRAVGQSPAQAALPLESDVAPHPVFTPWDNGQLLGELELGVLRQAGALHNAREALTTRSLRRGLPAAPSAPSPYFEALARRLAAAGIAVSLENRQLAFHFANPDTPDAVFIERALPHPWLPEQPQHSVSEQAVLLNQSPTNVPGERVRRVGPPPPEAGPAAERAFAALLQANYRLRRWLEANTSAPRDPSLETQSRPFDYLSGLTQQLSTRLSAYFDALLPPAALRAAERQAFSGQAVIAPAIGQRMDEMISHHRLDQVGLPEAIARALFPSQTGKADADLSERIAHSWIIVHRSPAVTPTALIAFHPVLVPGSAIRLHPQACALLNADFDGDQVAVYLPLSEAAQREAGEKLSVAAHITRDPQLIAQLLPPHEGLWGLADLSLDENGRRQIAATLRVAEDRIAAPLDQSTLAILLREVFDREGAPAVLQTANALAHLGYARAGASGASLHPFPQSQVPLPLPPQSDNAAEWEDYRETYAEAILSGRDYANPNLGPQLLSAAVRQRSRRFLPILIGPRWPAKDAAGETVIIRGNFVDGHTPQELFAAVAGARQGLAKLAFESEEILQESTLHSGQIGGAITVLARARRARRPGIVFARAAASAEIDPLTDPETRLLLGL